MRVKCKTDLKISELGQPPLFLKAGKTFSFDSPTHYQPYEKTIEGLISSKLLVQVTTALPKEETPKEETPKEETPKEETPKEETPKEETVASIPEVKEEKSKPVRRGPKPKKDK